MSENSAPRGNVCGDAVRDEPDAGRGAPGQGEESRYHYRHAAALHQQHPCVRHHAGAKEARQRRGKYGIEPQAGAAGRVHVIQHARQNERYVHDILAELHQHEGTVAASRQNVSRPGQFLTPPNRLRGLDGNQIVRSMSNQHTPKLSLA